MNHLLNHHLGILSLGSAALWLLGFYERPADLSSLTLFYLILLTFLSIYQLVLYLRELHPSGARRINQALGLIVSARVILELLGGFTGPFYPVLFLVAGIGSALFSVPVALSVVSFTIAGEHLHDWVGGHWADRYPVEVVKQALLLLSAFVPGWMLGRERQLRQTATMQLRTYQKDADSFDFLKYSSGAGRGNGLEEASKSQRERDVTSLLNRTDQPLEEVATHLFNCLKPYTAAVFLVDNSRGTVWMRVAKTVENRLEACHAIPIRDTLFAWPFSQKKSLYIPEIKSADVLSYYTKPPAIRSVYCAPIVSGDSVEGFILLDFLKERAFDKQNEGLVDLAVTCAGHAINNLKTMQKVHQEGIVFATFNHALERISSSLNLREIAKSVAEITKGVLECDVAALAIYETIPERIAIYHPIGLRLLQARASAAADEGEPIVVRPGEGIIGWTIDHREPFPKLTVEDRTPLLGEDILMEEIRSFVCLPLNIKEQCHGALLVGSYERNYFDARDLHLLRNIVSQSALAVAHAKAYREKEMQSLTDGLTNLYNRRYFIEALEREIDRVERFPQEFCILLMDLDHFKNINDTFGHPAGDLVLKKVARQLRKSTRRIDTIARHGGEEFAAILVNTGEKEGGRFANRVREDVGELSFSVAELGVPGKGLVEVKCSIGLATYPHDARNSKDLVDRADKALYYAKNTGRNRVSSFSKVKNLIPM